MERESRSGSSQASNGPSLERSLFDELALLSESKREERLSDVARSDAALAARLRALLRFHDGSELPEPTRALVSDSITEVDLGEPTSARETNDPFIGTRFGSFELRRIIGSGGMGVVYEAWQDTPARRVAVKVLGGLHASSEGWRRFELEIAALGSLHHPGIAQVFAAGVAETPLGNLPWYAMEFVDGPTLAAVAAAKPVELDERIELIARIADSIEHAHRRGIIHRDLKPSNILIESGPGGTQPKVLDFGVAKIVGNDTNPRPERTLTGQIIGTLQYMSPEQAAGESSQVDARSDVYALGMIAFELLAGERPYETDGLTLNQSVSLICDRETPRLGARAPACDGDLEVVVGKALSKERDRRYSTAGEFAADLRRVLHHEPISARPPSRVYRLLRAAQRNRVLVGGVAATILALLGGVIGTSIALVAANAARNDAHQRAEEARFQQYVAEISTANAAIAVGDSETARARLDAAPEEFRHFEWNYLGARHDVSIARLAGDGITRLDMSRDGQRIAAVDEQGLNLLSREASDWKIVRIGTLSSIAHDIELSDDGSTIVVAETFADGYSCWDAFKGMRRYFVATHNAPVHAIALSHSMEFVAAGGEDGEIVICDASTGEVVARNSGTPPIQHLRFDKDDSRLMVVEGHAVVELAFPDLRETRRVDLGPTVGDRPAFDHSFKRVAFKDGNGVAIADLESGTRPRSIHRESIDPLCFSWNSDGSILAVGERSGAITLWDTASGKLSATLRGHTTSLNGLAFDPTDPEILYSAADGLRAWHTAFPEPDIDFQGHFRDCWVAGFSADGSRFVTSHGRDYTVRVWDTETGECVAVLAPPFDTNADGLALSPDGKLLAVANYHGAIEVWDVDEYHQVAQIQGMREKTLALRFTPDGASLVAVREVDGTARRFETGRWTEIGSTPGEGRLYAAAISSDGRRIASCGRTSEPSRLTIDVRDSVTGVLLQRSEIDQAVDWCRLRFESESLLLVLNHNSAFTIDVSGQVTSFPTMSGPIHASISPDGRRLVCGLPDGRIRFFDVQRSGQDVAVIIRQRSTIAPKFSPDGKRLVATWPDGQISIFQAEPSAFRITNRLQQRNAMRAADRILHEVRTPNDTAESLATRITTLPGLSPEVRRSALRAAHSIVGTREGLTAHCWQVARDSSASRECLEIAVGSLGAIAGTGNVDTQIHVIAAALSLRLGDAEAGWQDLEIASRTIDPNTDAWWLALVAYRALVLRQLGRRDEAENEVEVLRTLRTDSRWSLDRSMQELLDEALRGD